MSSAVTPAVEAVGLRKSFGPIHAVDGIDLAGLAKATGGEARILGTRMPDRPTLGRIGYMPQSEALYPELSVAENIGFFATLQGARAEGAIDRVLDLVELGGRKGATILELSGGMRRRLSLAITLVHEPSVLFLDEPTVGVDPALRVQFWSHFRRLADGGTTILVASHVMDEADRCDELLFIRDGRVIARGSPTELRATAGTDNLEAAFLRFAGLDDEGRPLAGGGPLVGGAS